MSGAMLVYFGYFLEALAHQLMMRTLLNRWRRRLARALLQLHESLVRRAAHTRIAPSTCIEGEYRPAAGGTTSSSASSTSSMPRTAWWSKRASQITNFCSIVTHSTHDACASTAAAPPPLGGELPGYRKAPSTSGPKQPLSGHTA